MQTFSNISSKIYVNTQRIASKPAGNADRFNVLQVGDTPDLEELRAKQLADAQLVADSMELGQLNLAQPGSGVIFIPVVFYFHPDHLGSSTLITDNFGDPYQFFLNLPFGETFAEQRRSGTLNNPYKFNGKELDEETGLYYYGARYYNPRTSVWLSVDPIALWQPVQEVEHYIEGQHNGGYFNPKNMSVYGYTYQNPINYIDPNGKQIFVTHGTTQNTGKGVFSKNVLSEFKRITGNTYIDDKFSWKAPLLNNATNHRALAAKQLIKHVVSERNKLIKSGTISKDEPVTLLGYSHGGNVDIQAIDEISKQLGVKVNLITVSTPAYNSEESLKKSELAGLESPAEKTSIATHLHFVHRNDIVQSVAQGDKTYAPSSNHPVLNNIVDKYWVPIQGGIDSHTEFPRNQGFADYLKYVNSINK